MAMAKEPGEEPRQYVYGIVRPGRSLRIAHAGLGESAGVGLIRHRDVAALASEVGAEPIVATRATLAGHSEVQEEAFARTTLLPLRFGTVFPNSGVVVSQLLEPQYELLTGLLDEMEGLAELTLKGYYEEEAVLREIVASDSSIRALRDRVRGRTGEGAYAASIRLGELVAGALDARRTNDADRIVERLSRLARSAKLAPVAVERGVVNASFLVEKTVIPAFDEEVQSIGREYAALVRFKYVGPLPPYTFVDISLDQEAVRWAS
jgi:Gas vesicle synthesis protein GvpL/GvpF